MAEFMNPGSNEDKDKSEDRNKENRSYPYEYGFDRFFLTTHFSSSKVASHESNLFTKSLKDQSYKKHYY